MDKVITASREELVLCPGLGPQKVRVASSLYTSHLWYTPSIGSEVVDTIPPALQDIQATGTQRIRNQRFYFAISVCVCVCACVRVCEYRSVTLCACAND